MSRRVEQPERSAEAEVRDVGISFPPAPTEPDTVEGRARPGALFRWGFFRALGALAAIAAAAVVWSVRELLLRVLVALFLAVSLDPAVRWGRPRRPPGRGRRPDLRGLRGHPGRVPPLDHPAAGQPGRRPGPQPPRLPGRAPAALGPVPGAEPALRPQHPPGRGGGPAPRPPHRRRARADRPGVRRPHLLPHGAGVHRLLPPRPAPAAPRGGPGLHRGPARALRRGGGDHGHQGRRLHDRPVADRLRRRPGRLRRAGDLPRPLSAAPGHPDRPARPDPVDRPPDRGGRGRGRGGGHQGPVAGHRPARRLLPGLPAGRELPDRPPHPAPLGRHLGRRGAAGRPGRRDRARHRGRPGRHPGGGRRQGRPRPADRRARGHRRSTPPPPPALPSPPPAGGPGSAPVAELSRCAASGYAAAMANPDVFTMVLAGGEGKRLAPLTADRAKPAVPFGGDYRLVDFVLSNLVNGGYMRIAVLTQYKSHSLDRHVTTTWRLSPLLGGYVTPVPAQMRRGPRWFAGSADAIFQSLNLVYDERPDYVIVFGADHVYRMDPRQMVQQHIDSGTGVTVAGIRVPIGD